MFADGSKVLSDMYGIGIVQKSFVAYGKIICIVTFQDYFDGILETATFGVLSDKLSYVGAPSDKVGAILAVKAELDKATEKHGSMRSAHEGYAVILEELDEAWDEIKRNDLDRAREEMVQVAAMAIRFLMDVK